MTKEKYAVADCPVCQDQTPIDTAIAKKDDIEVKMVWCVVCENVLNLTDDIEIQWVTEKWLNQRGWHAAE